MKAEFDALVKDLRVRSLASMDKSVWLKLEFNDPGDELMDSLNRLHRPDELVKVTIEKGDG